MIALLKKDLALLLLLLLGGTGGLVLAFEDPGYARLWIFPPYRLEAPFHVSWALGLLLGLLVGLRDEVLQTHEFLHHRPVSPATIQRARLLGCGLVLAGWLLLPPIVHWLLQAAFGEMAALHQWHHLTTLWTAQLPMLSSCALGLWIARLPLPPLQRLLGGAAVWLCCFSLLHELGRLDAWRIDVAPWVLGHLLTTGVLVLAAFAGGRPDADRPWTRGQRTAFGLPLAVSLAVTFCYLVTALQENHAHALSRAQPYLVAHGENVLLVTRAEERGSTVFRVVDDEHRPAGSLPEGVNGADELWQNFARLGRDPEVEGPRFGHNSSGGNSMNQAQLDEHGELYVLRRHSRTFDDAKLLRLTRPGGGRFTTDARVLWNRDEAGAVWLAEPDAPEVWMLGPEAEQLVAVPLPDGERTHPRWPVYWSSPAGGVFHGRTRSFLVQGRELRPAPASIERPAEPQMERVRVLGSDPLQPRVQVLGSDGEVVFEHDFALRTGAERWHAGLCLAWSTLRPPFLQAWGHLTTAEPAESAPALDGLVRGGQRTWLVLLAVGVGLALAWRTRRRLLWLGAPADAVRLWTVVTVLLGPLGWGTSLLIETRRAHATSPLGIARDPDQAPPPRVLGRLA